MSSRPAWSTRASSRTGSKAREKTCLGNKQTKKNVESCADDGGLACGVSEGSKDSTGPLCESVVSGQLGLKNQL